MKRGRVDDGGGKEEEEEDRNELEVLASLLSSGGGGAVNASGDAMKWIMKEKNKCSSLLSLDASYQRLQDARQDLNALQMKLSEQCILEAALLGLVVPDSDSAKSSELMKELLDTRASLERIATLQKTKTALQRQVADLQASAKQWESHVPTFAHESSLLAKLVPVTSLVVGDESGAIVEARSPLEKHYSVNFCSNRRDNLPLCLEKQTVEISNATTTLVIAYCPEWGLVVAKSMGVISDASHFSLSARDNGKRFPSLKASYKVAMRKDADSMSEASILRMMGDFRPFQWCQQLCGIRCFAVPPEVEGTPMDVSMLLKKLE